MKATGIVRKVDNLGRLVIPKELRDALSIDLKDPLEIFTKDDFLILRKSESGCICCGSLKNNIFYKDKSICITCIEDLANTYV